MNQVLKYKSNVSSLNEIDQDEFDQRFLYELSKKFDVTEKQRDQIVQMANKSDCSYAQAVVRIAICGEEDAAQFMADILNCGLVSKVAECPPAPLILAALNDFSLNVDWCIEQQVFIIKNDMENDISVFLSEPNNAFALSVVQTVTTNYSIQYKLLTPAMVASIIDELIRERAVSELFGQSALTDSALAEEAPVINLVNGFLDKAVQAEASDIHIEAGERNMCVRFRVDGVLTEYMQQPMSRFAAIASRIKLLSDIDISERRLPQDGRFTTRNIGKEFDIRVSTAPNVHGESIVMRLLPKKREQLSLKHLGFESDHLDVIRRWGKLPNGIVLVTGPTGSGKSTTLYGLLSDIKTGSEKIVTVEDPVEYQLEGITQVQARPDIGYTFAKALRTFLRQDPDVIMVGEIRDKETAEIAVQSSLTGHLVLSTLHTNDACSVFPRLADIGIEPFLTSATIQGVQAQRLVKKLCEHCSIECDKPAFIEETFEQSNWRKAVGCPKCQGRGYRGRIGIYELIDVTPTLRQIISSGGDVMALRKQAKQEGARTLMEDGMIKASKGVTSVEEVLRVCSSEDN